MKNYHSVALVAVIVGLAVLLAVPAAQASVLYWQTGGSGYWDTDLDWGIDMSGGGALPWVPGDDAYFYQTSTGTVSIYSSAAAGNVTFNAAGYVVTGGSLSVTGSITANQNATIDSVLVGSSGLTTGGPAALVLGGNNTYTGATTITAGTLQIGAGSASGSINGSSGVVNNGVLAFDRPDNVTFSLPISGSGGVTQLGSGTLALTSSRNSYTGPTTISSGVVQLPNLTSNLIAYYPLSTTLNDSTVYGNNGVSAGTGTVAYFEQFLRKRHRINFPHRQRLGRRGRCRGQPRIADWERDRTEQLHGVGLGQRLFVDRRRKHEWRLGH